MTPPASGLLRQLSDTAPQTRDLVFYLAGRPVAQLALETGEPERWWSLTTDHLGMPLVATDGAGDELWENRFEPFGRDLDQGTPWGALENEMFRRFPGQMGGRVGRLGWKCGERSTARFTKPA